MFRWSGILVTWIHCSLTDRAGKVLYDELGCVKVSRCPIYKGRRCVHMEVSNVNNWIDSILIPTALPKSLLSFLLFSSLEATAKRNQVPLRGLYCPKELDAGLFTPPKLNIFHCGKTNWKTSFWCILSSLNWASCVACFLRYATPRNIPLRRW